MMWTIPTASQLASAYERSMMNSQQIWVWRWMLSTGQSLIPVAFLCAFYPAEKVRLSAYPIKM